MSKKITIGIMPQDKIRERMLAIARGEYKPKASDPKIWFTSMKSLAEVLSDENRALLRIIEQAQPDSISVLAELTGRKQSNLSRTLKTMSSYGLVEMHKGKRQVRPVAMATEFQILAA
jgi:predicted transcriptional regulator